MRSWFMIYVKPANGFGVICNAFLCTNVLWKMRRWWWASVGCVRVAVWQQVEEWHKESRVSADSPRNVLGLCLHVKEHTHTHTLKHVGCICRCCCCLGGMEQQKDLKEDSSCVLVQMSRLGVAAPRWRQHSDSDTCVGPFESVLFQLRRWILWCCRSD